MRILKGQIKTPSIRFAADAGGSSGSPPGDNQQQQQTGNWWDKIDMDSLDDEARGAVEKAKTDFATLQSRAAAAEELVRTHQSARDRATAELDKLRKSATSSQPPVQTTEDRVFADLIASNIPEPQARAQAKTLATILDKERQQIKAEFGRDMAPVVSITLENKAQQVFNHARATDRIGALQVPEVAQLVWNSCLELAANGQDVSVETVKNLASMHLGNHLEKTGGHFASLQTTNPQPSNGMPPTPTPPFVPFNGGFNTGGAYSYPGAHLHSPSTPRVPDPNAPKHNLDATTAAALEQVKKVWQTGLGQAPK